MLTVVMVGYERTRYPLSIVDNENSFLEITLPEKRISLAQVSITPAKEISSSTVSGLDLKLRPANSTQDLLRLVPGLFIAQHAGGGKAEQIFLRGFDVDHGTDVAVTVDGMPVNMVSHAHGQGYADLHFVIPELVDNLSFSKGPYDARTGDLNTAGAVRFQTRNYLPQSFVKLEGGQFGTFRGVAAVNLLGQDDSSTHRQNAYVAAEVMQTDGFFDSPQDFSRLNLLAKYSYALDRNTRFQLSASHFTSQWDASGQIPDRAVAAGSITRFGSLDATEGGNVSRQNLNLIVSRLLPGGGLFRNQIYFVHNQFNLYSNFTFFLNDSVNGDQIRQYEDRQIYGYRGSYSITHTLAGMDFTTTAGVDFRNDQIGQIGLAHTVKRRFLEDYKKGAVFQTNAGAYAEESVRLSPRLTASLGARFDVFRFRYDDALTDTINKSTVKAIVSPKLNLFYNLTPKAQVYFSAGTGFHSNDARVATAAPNGRTLPRATGADLGLNWKLGERLFLNAAAWMLHLQNEFVYVGDEAVVEVSGASRRVGVDMSARYQLTSWLFADADVNLTRPRLIEEPEGAQNIPLAPRVTSIGGLSVKMGRGINGSLRYRYLGDRPANEDNSIVARGYTIMDAVINYTTPRYVLALSAENLFDRKWKEAQFATESRLRSEATSVEEIHFTPGTPLFVKGSVTYSF